MGENMKKMFALLYFTLLFAIPLFGKDDTHTDTYLLRYKFVVGKETAYQLNINDWEKIKISGRPIERKQEMVIHLIYKKEGVDEDGNGILRCLYGDATYQGKKVGLAGKETRIRISPTGHILESEGMQEVFAEFAKVALKSFSAYIPGLDRIPVKIDFSRMASNQFNPLYQAFLPTFPVKEVAIGDTWLRQEGVVELADRRASRVQYRLESVNDGCAEIVLVPPEPRVPRELEAESEEASISAAGRVLFSITDGEPIFLETELILQNVNTSFDPADLKSIVDVPGGQPPVQIGGDKKTTFILQRLEESQEEEKESDNSTSGE